MEKIRSCKGVSPLSLLYKSLDEVARMADEKRRGGKASGVAMSYSLLVASNDLRSSAYFSKAVSHFIVAEYSQFM